jgi:uncharacterized membrane protein
MVKRGHIKYYYLLVFSLILGGFLRFYRIGGQPIWLDEAWSYWYSGRTIFELWSSVARVETNPPLYYTILKLWRGLFGSSEAGLRSLSAVMSIGCIPLVFMLGRLMGKSIGGDWIGAIAASLFSVAAVHIQYAQEARPYEMLTFATTLTLCAFLWVMRHPAEACEPIIRKSFNLKQCSTNGIGYSKFFPWMTIIIAIAFTLWLHSTSILYIFTLSLIMLAWFFLQLGANKTFLNNSMLIAFSVILLWGPYLVFLIPQTMHAVLPIPKPTVPSTIDTVSWLLLGNSIPLYEIKAVAWLLLGHSIPWNAWMVNAVFKIVACTFLIALATAGLVNIWRRSGQYISLLILGAIIGPILMELVFSFTVKPIFLPRTLIYVSVPFYIAIGAGIMMLGDSRKRVLVTVVVLLILFRWTYNYYANYQKEPWDKVAQIVAQQTEKGVVLLIPCYIEVPFSYYAKKISNNGLQIIPLPYPLAYSLRPAPGLGRSGSPDVPEKMDEREMPFRWQVRPSDIPSINKVIANKSPVWLITRSPDFFDSDRIVLNALMKRDLVSTWHFGEISLFKFK